MSDSVMKKTPNFFRQDTLRKAGNTLRQPIAIAALAAIGVHGSLWFILPLLERDNKPPDDHRSVRVIELSPLEQSRLPKPDLSSSLTAPKTTDPKSSNPFSSEVPLSPPAPAADSLYNVPGLSSSNTNPYPDFTPKKSRTKPKPESTKEPDPEKTSPNNGEQPTDPENKGDAGKLLNEDGSPPSKGRNQDADKALRDRYSYNSANTSTQDWINNSSGVSETIASKYGIRNLAEKPIKLELPYPKEACPFKSEVEKNVKPEAEKIKIPIGFTVVISPDKGTVVEKWLTRSSGFKGFDEAATKFLEEAIPKNLTEKWKNLDDGDKPKQPQAYAIEVNMLPTAETCTAAAPKSSGAQ